MERFVAILDLGPDRLFCSDRFRDEWTGIFGLAEQFYGLHEANKAAQRHGGRVMTWAEAYDHNAVAMH